jgi:putative heme-binding domain-containing protein
VKIRRAGAVFRGTLGTEPLTEMRSPAAGLFAAVFAVVASAAQTPQPSSGDAATGRAIFEGSAGCLRCHSVDRRGGNIGPDLSWIGILRTPESLRTSLTDPDAQVSPRHVTVVVETRPGEQVIGHALNEDDLSIQIRDANGELRSFVKTDLKDLRREPRSLMPAYAPKLPPDAIDHLVAYLRTLRKLRALEAGEPRAIPRATENAAFFDRPDRDRDERPDVLLAALGIAPGSTVADVGSGTGYFTWRLARQVGPAGKVYAVDVQQAMLDLTRRAVASRGLDNVEYVLATATDPRLPEGAIDLAFIAYAYHEFADPPVVMAAIRRALKPGGRIFVLEYAKESDVAPASTLHRMSFDEIRREIEPMGFVVDRLFDFLLVQHGVVFTVRR